MQLLAIIFPVVLNLFSTEPLVLSYLHDIQTIFI